MNNSNEELREIIINKVISHRDVQSSTNLQPIDISPILFDPHCLDAVAELFWKKFAPYFPFQVTCVESAALPLLGALVLKGAQKGYFINSFFIRKSRKKTTNGTLIEGIITDNTIVLIDDFINSGKTCGRAIEVLHEIHKKIDYVFAIVRFNETAYYSPITENIPVETLFSPTDFGLLPPARTEKITPPRKIYEILWTFKSLDPTYVHVVPKSAPIIDSHKIYFGADNRNFWALHQNDGSIAWKFRVGPSTGGKSIFSSPVIHKDHVFFGSYDGNVYALNTSDGSRAWTFREAEWIGSSPALAPQLNLLFIGLEFGLWRKKGGIAALNMKTGQKMWEQYMPEYTHSSPAYFHPRRVVIVGCNDGEVRAYHAKTGKQLWHFKTRGPVRENFAFDEQSNQVFFGSHDGYIYALNIRTGKKISEFDTGEAIYSAPLVYKNIVCIASLNKNIYGLDRITLQQKWVFQTQGRIFASPRLFNGNIFIGSNDGRMYEINVTTGKGVSFFQTAERIVNKVAYNETTKRIFLPTFANEIFCIQKKQP